MKKQKGGGNRAAQARRRNERARKQPPPGDYEILIDGNISRYAVAYCDRYAGFLTVGLMETHDCIARHCGRLIKVYEHGADTETKIPPG